MDADSLLEWLASLSSRPVVHQWPEVHDALLTAISEIQAMCAQGAPDQPRVDEFFRQIVEAIERKRRSN
jgi:hypothetical protein